MRADPDTDVQRTHGPVSPSQLVLLPMAVTLPAPHRICVYVYKTRVC